MYFALIPPNFLSLLLISAGFLPTTTTKNKNQRPAQDRQHELGRAMPSFCIQQLEEDAHIFEVCRDASESVFDSLCSWRFSVRRSSGVETTLIRYNWGHSSYYYCKCTKLMITTNQVAAFFIRFPSMFSLYPTPKPHPSALQETHRLQEGSEPRDGHRRLEPRRRATEHSEVFTENDALMKRSPIHEVDRLKMFSVNHCVSNYFENKNITPNPKKEGIWRFQASRKNKTKWTIQQK